MRRRMKVLRRTRIRRWNELGREIFGHSQLFMKLLDGKYACMFSGILEHENHQELGALDPDFALVYRFGLVLFAKMAMSSV